MIQLFELKRYEERELKKLFDVDDSKWEHILFELLRKNIVAVKQQYVQFNYVGIVIVDKFTIFIFPKYLMFEKTINQEAEIKVLMDLFNKFSHRENLDRDIIEDMDLYSEESDNKFIPIVLFLIEDYLQNGIYYNEIDSVERDGAGEINWNITIDQVMPLYIKGNLLYPEVRTNCVSSDFHYIISKIHRIVIKECVDFINNTGLKYIINHKIDLDEMLIDESIDIEVLRYEIEKEIRVQFNDQKRRVLYSILAYLDEKASVLNEKILLYGTRNFKWIWEELCSIVFKNQFIADQHLSKYDKFMLFPPQWLLRGSTDVQLLEDNNEISMKKNRLTPDILRVVDLDGKKYILILDAKYYSIRTIQNGRGELKIINNPGIGDVTKQYFYQMALADYMDKNNITGVINAFLFPSTSYTELMGEVKLDFMEKYPHIILIKLNVQDMVQMYCNRKIYDLEDIKLLFLKTKSEVDR